MSKESIESSEKQASHTSQKKQEDMVIFYHGTTMNKLRGDDGIFRKGLDPDKGGTGNTLLSKTQGSTDYKDKSNDKNHVTTSFESATFYALQASGNDEDNAVVLAIKVSTAFAQKNFATDVGNTNNKSTFFTLNTTDLSFVTPLLLKPDMLYVAKSDSKGIKLEKMQEHEPTITKIRKLDQITLHLKQAQALHEEDQKIAVSKTSSVSQHMASMQSGSPKQESTSLKLSIKLPKTQSDATKSKSDDEWDDSSRSKKLSGS